MSSNTLYIIGIGFSSDYLTLKSLSILKKVKEVFLDGYTSVLLDDGKSLRTALGRDYKVLYRRDIEELDAKIIFEALKEGDVALLVPGDALIATTHVNLVIEARKRGYSVEIVPGVSVISAAMSLSGLMVYKFGKIATLTYPKDGIVYEYVYDVVKENMLRNLHTLLLLEIDVERGLSMSIHDAIDILLMLENLRGEGVISKEHLAVGMSRLGGRDMKVCFGSLQKLMEYDFGNPPHTLIITSPKLHFIEEEALVVINDIYCR